MFSILKRGQRPQSAMHVQAHNLESQAQFLTGDRPTTSVH